MRSAEDILQDLEGDRSQREAEIRAIDNLAAGKNGSAEQVMIFRSLVLLTYAHLEGFCKFALLSYISAVNSMGLLCRDATSAIVAAALGDVFAALRDINSKHPEFNRDLPVDRDLHMLWRQRTFVESHARFTEARVEIPDRLVDTKANLNSTILKRNLYSLGLNHLSIDKHQKSIDMLLGMRNAIAHGDRLKAPTAQQIAEYRAAAFEVMSFVQDEIFSALRQQIYLRSPKEESA